MSVIAAGIRQGWHGELHPKYPLLVALIPVAYQVVWFLAFGYQIPEFTLDVLPLLEVLTFAFVAIGVWSTLALWRCAYKGSPIWPATWRGLAVVLGAYNIGVCGLFALLLLLMRLSF